MELTISSLSKYVEAICSLNTALSNDDFILNEVLLFRGQTDSNYDLIPSLGRNRTSACSLSIFNQERNLIEMAKYKLPDIFKDNLQPIELLALLQHHGIPTRLLDVTENALVALYFACCSSHDKDGEVFAFKHKDMDITNYPIMNAIADSYRFSRGTVCFLSNFYHSVISQPYFLEQKDILNVCIKDDVQGGKWIYDCCRDPLFIFAPVRTLRQQLQQGRYILFPNKISCQSDIATFESLIDPLPKNHKSICGRFIIPSKEKTHLIKELRLLGISQSTLFADSTDTICKDIVERFSFNPEDDD